jgi:hypothetical protein
MHKLRFDTVTDIDSFKTMRLPSGRYLINKMGDIISLNSGVPRYVPVNQKRTGECFVVLYIPSMILFNVAELVLMTFIGKSAPDQVVCYKDYNYHNVALDNLYWGDQDEQMAHLTKQNIRQIENAIEYQNLHPDDHDEQAPCPNQVLYVNKIMLQDLMTLSVNFNQFYIDKIMHANEVVAYRKLNAIVSEIIPNSVILPKKLNSILEIKFLTQELVVEMSRFETVINAHQLIYQKAM